MNTTQNTPTPRTDREAFSADNLDDLNYLVVTADFARTLERELTQARKNYFDVADAITRESFSPADLCNQARAIRTRAEKAEAELAELKQSHASIYAALCTQEADHTKWPEQITALRAALENFIDVGCEYYDMDCGPNGSAAIVQARAALGKEEDGR